MYCGQNTDTLVQCSKGLRCLCRKPLAFNHQLVAGDRNAPRTPILIVPFWFELVREVAA